jgi:hypothetical protein
MCLVWFVLCSLHLQLKYWENTLEAINATIHVCSASTILICEYVYVKIVGGSVDVLRFN